MDREWGEQVVLWYTFVHMSNQDEKKMVQGDWSCSGCGGGIKELPFEPRGTENLLCRDCHSKKREAQGERKMVSGNWSCKGCAGTVTELPFEPRETSNILCRDCYKKSRAV